MNINSLAKSLKFKGYNDNEGREYVCPFCGDTVVVNKDVFYGRCPACHATVVDYKPLPHQIDFHKSNALYRLLMGGYGTGKTTMCVAEVAEHVLTVPKGRTLITAPKLQQVTDAILPELDKFIAPWMIVDKKKSPTPRYTLKNGHEIVVYASNDDEKLRSLNLTMFYMEEASAIDVTVFHQLQARLRNTAALTKDKFGRVIKDSRKGVVSSNPEQGWLVDDFLLYANKIFASKSVDISAYTKLQKKPERAFEAFLSSSRDNPYLPPGQIANWCAGKPLFWIRKYIDCALEIRQGAVYPNFADVLVPDFPIPPNWKRVIGFDKGFKDETAMIIGAIEPKTGIIYCYKEYYVSQQPISYHAKMVKEMLKGLPMYNNVQADPSVLHRSDRDGRSYQDYFYKLSEIHLEPANNSIAMGIDKVRDYMYTGKLKIFQSLVNTKTEAMGYIYPDREVNQKEEIPVDKNNHLMDAMRYMIMALPQNPYDMVNIASAYVSQSDVDRFWKTNEEDDKSVYVLGEGVM